MNRPIQPTPDQVRRAFEGLAARHEWAEPFEAVMRDPLRSRLVRAMAVGMAARRGRIAAENARQPPKPARGSVLSAAPPSAPPPFDHKRAAAGDCD